MIDGGMKIVLMYHDIYCESVSESGFQNASAFQYKVQVEEFEAHVAAVSEYCKNHPDVKVDFTFDDGGCSFYTLAAPILEKYDRRGTFFISTNYLDTPLFLSMEQLRMLAKRGHRVGSHSHSHPALTCLGEESIAEEWKVSVRKLKGCVIGGMTASVPNGDGNKVVMQKALEAGIQTLYTSVPTTKVNDYDGMKVVGRYVVYQGMSTTDVMSIVGSKSKRRLMYVKWWLLRMVKGALGSNYNKLKRVLFPKHALDCR